MFSKIIQWLYVLLGIIALVFFFLPFHIWNWLAAGTLGLLFVGYFLKAVKANLAYQRRQRIEFGIFAIVLSVLIVILSFQGIPIFAWVLFVGLIANLLVRVLR